MKIIHETETHTDTHTIVQSGREINFVLTALEQLKGIKMEENEGYRELPCVNVQVKGHFWEWIVFLVLISTANRSNLEAELIGRPRIVGDDTSLAISYEQSPIIYR